MEDPKLIAYLISLHLQDNISEEEEQLLASWLDEHPDNRTFFEQATQKPHVAADLSDYHKLWGTMDTAWDSNRLYHTVKIRITADNVTGLRIEPKRRATTRWWAYAAACLVLFFALGYLWVQLGDDNLKDVTPHSAIAQIAPGTNRALLRMADGKIIPLKDGSEGIHMRQGINYVNGETLLRADELLAMESSETALLTLEVLAKSYYQIVLSDGTKVWLNAKSKLLYPTQFAQDRREVELEGEAYFEVASLHSGGIRVPFFVRSGDQLLEVLGTKFNIAAYPDEEPVKTTLLEGKVLLSDLKQNIPSVYLTPGNQSSLYQGEFNIRQVDMEQAIAWKNGFFQFDGADAKDAFGQLARWYDIDVIYVGNRPKVSFFGMIERNKKLGVVLDILQKSGMKFKTRVKGDRKQLIVEEE